MYGDLPLARALLCGPRMRTRTRNLAWTMLFLVAACGGGGGGDDDTPSPDALDQPDGSGPGVCNCVETAPTPTRGSAIAITPDDQTLVSCNRDAGSVTIARVDYSDGDPALS